MSATLFGASMNPDTWLQTIIAPLSSKPSIELQRFFSSCDRDVTTEVLIRADIILEAIFPNCGPEERSLQGSLMDNVWAEQRRFEAMKLYYKVLHTICMAEAEVLLVNNLTSLLTNDRFHRCLLACSAELILATHSTVPMLFPAVFERTGITAFDLIKVIESFIRHEVSLPRELRRHLNSLEEQFLESIAWEKGSSLYNTLLIARPNLSAEIDHLGLQAGPMPSLHVIAMHMNMPCVSFAQKDEVAPDQNEDLRSPKRLRRESQSVLVERHSFTSPVKNRLLALKSMKPGDLSPVSRSTTSSSPWPSPRGREETYADKAITKFFGKIVKLAAVRINAMVERLQYSQQMRDTIFVFFQKILNERTALFFNRHIDQIILCCFYGVAKILQLNPTLAEIFSSYRKQPQCKPQVLSGVYIYRTPECSVRKIGHDHISMLNFYNQVFILAAKPLLDELTMVETVQTDNRGAEAGKTSESQILMSPKASPFPSLSGMSPKATPFPSLPDMSPKKVSAAHNVYVSPMRASKMETLMSCNGGSYYAFVGEATQPYQSPSKDLNVINNHLKCTRTVRRALNFNNFRGQFISDSLVEL